MDENHQDIPKKERGTWPLKFGMWWEKIQLGLGWLWQKIQQHPFVTMGIILLIALIAFALAVHWLGWDWTGFTGYSPPTPQYQRGKTLWDWLQLLVIPLMLAIGGFWLNQIQKSRDERTTAQRDKTEHEITLDKQREDLLQTYLDRMSELLLEKQLRSPTSPYEIRNVTRAEVRNVARAQTITILFQLDARRIGYVFAFLREAGLMSTTSESIVSLKDANLRSINFSQAMITKVDLRDTDLMRANLSGAYLSHANLSGAILIYADLSEANLYQANLSSADLSGAYLSGAYLSEANLSGANLLGANLSGAYLSHADLSGAYLGFVTLSGATLSDANLEKTILKGARYNTKEIPIRDSQGNITVQLLPTQWPQGFNPKAAGAIEDNTFS